tara:strand:- start:235 stop:726 length:492 start_codon:yes stop_codon:yes gene_type:complete
MEKIFLLVALFSSSGVEERVSRDFCDNDRCVTYETLSEEDNHSEYLFWYGIDVYEKFRTEVVAPNATRCRTDDMLVVISDLFVPKGVSGSYTLLDKDNRERIESDSLITVESYKSAPNFHHVFGHEFGHYLHDQYCLTIDSEIFAAAVGNYFRGQDFNIALVR